MILYQRQKQIMYFTQMRYRMRKMHLNKKYVRGTYKVLFGATMADYYSLFITHCVFANIADFK